MNIFIIIIGISVLVIGIFFLIRRMKKTIKTVGLTKEDIDELEDHLKKKLPKNYKDLLMNYPNDLIHLGAPYNTVSELSLPNTKERIIEINKDEDPPENILIIGVNGLGDFYYMILDDDTNKVYEFPHDDPPYNKNGDFNWSEPWSFNSLQEFTNDLKERLK